MKNKKWILLLIILFPSAFWLILETSTINSKKLPYYGPRSFNGTDSVYYSTGTISFKVNNVLKKFDTISYPLLTLSFVKPTYANEAYRLKGVTDYSLYEKKDIDKLPLVIVSPDDLLALNNVKDSLKIELKNIEQAYCDRNSFDSINRVFFKEKPYYIDYSFIILLDKQRRIRGYYDGRYVSEVKRLFAEYKHIRLKEEKTQLIKENEIKYN
jgi:hypothetical protein